MHFSIGAHPAFLCPIYGEEDKTGYSLYFEGLTEVHHHGNTLDTGMSLKEVHLKYGIPELQVKFYVISNGGKIRTSTDHKRKYTFNEHYFDKIDTKDKAY